MPARGDDGRSPRNVAGMAHISFVVTDPGRWGQGLATIGLTAVLSQARRRGYARCQLWVFEQNLPARHLYELAGFVRSPRAPRVHDNGDEPMLHYLKELGAPPAFARAAVRVLCLDSSGRVLLMHWRDPVDGHQLWEPPGGGVEADETPLDTARREWAEETGLPEPDVVGEPTTVARDEFWSGQRVVVDETFFLARLATAGTPEPWGFTDVETATFLGFAWVGRAELARLEVDGDPIEPDLVPVLERLNA
jgi:8-oxo-dGTP pyrophosphatase MutT (NUDIX family)